MHLLNSTFKLVTSVVEEDKGSKLLTGTRG
jgi:hypothetical protein